MGSFLFGKNTDEWKSAFERLKEDPDKEIIQVLRISFDGLCHYTSKEIFLHIACFFNHEKKDYIVKILESLGLFPIIGLKELTDKSLLKIYDDKLWMHDLLGEMGKNIVHQKSLNEPGKRSKLWLYKDIDYVLKNNKGSEVVQAIDIKGAIDMRGIYYEEKEARWRLRGSALLVTNVLGKEAIWNLNAFLKMPNLKFLRIRNINLLHVPKRLPNNLRFIEWSDYPSKSLPFFQLDELVQLHLQLSKIELLWEGMKNFDKLKSINLARSSNLIITPDFTGVPNLEELVLAWCSNLRRLHPSIRNLKKIILLDLKHCKELSCLPDKFEMESLKTLDLICSSKVKKIPEFLGSMKYLEELFLESTTIIELPSSIECLTGLYFLNLRDCKNLVCLPNTICSLTSLSCLDLFGCSKFDKLPKDLGNMVSLRRLVLGGTAIKELPLSVEFLIGLISLDLTDCKNFVFLPNSICSLKSLFRICLSGCSNFVNLPENLGSLEENLGNLEGLKKLSLKGTTIEVLPSSIGSLTALSSLDLSDCKNLLCLPSTICSLKKVEALYLSRCPKIVNLPENLGNMESLMSLCLSGTAIKELPTFATHLKRLMGVYFSECQWPSSSFDSSTLFCVLSCLSIEYLDLSDCHLSAISCDIDPYAFHL
ncbi:hypothetical protein RGQ29_019126 [Quercus rubra]|uniref:Uncharacterized protein n=1 Tax=Quercus rubra TaxID=3512 RepID=A0AAN7F992_QUERU|nr:hypothetical protein RGQ29_019126 [Quercus rubra]